MTWDATVGGLPRQAASESAAKLATRESKCTTAVQQTLHALWAFYSGNDVIGMSDGGLDLISNADMMSMLSRTAARQSQNQLRRAPEVHTSQSSPRDLVHRCTVREAAPDRRIPTRSWHLTTW